MTIKDALNYFENIVSQESNKSIIKACEGFVQIIRSLEKRNLSEKDIKSIELELDSLGLNSPTTKFHKALSEFKRYLKKTFSLTTKGYYLARGMTFGSSFGMLFGVAVFSNIDRNLGIPLGLGFGIAIGVLIGLKKDANAKAAGNIL